MTQKRKAAEAVEEPEVIGDREIFVFISPL